MEISQVLEISQAFLSALLLTLPALIVSLVVGLVMSILQTVTSIQEQTLSFTPRLLAVAAVLVLTLSWALGIAVQFTTQMLWLATEVTR